MRKKIQLKTHFTTSIVSLNNTFIVPLQKRKVISVISCKRSLLEKCMRLHGEEMLYNQNKFMKLSWKTCD